MSSETEESKAAIVLAIDVEMASGGAATGEVQAADAGNASGGGGAGQLQVVEAGQMVDDKEKAPEAVKEGEKKEARKQMDSRSEMWNHFEKILADGVLQKGKCNYCKTDIAAHTVHNGTSALRKHFNVCKRNPHKNIGDSKQTVLQVNNGDSVHAWKFDPKAIRNSFAAMIIEDELPFAFGEKSRFKKFVSVACPLLLVPSRRTCTRDTVRIYFEEKSKLKLFLKEQCERVCLTTDCWTSQQQESFMTVTAHFICNEWKLHKKIISFFKVKGHKGDDIGKHLKKTLIDWGVEKVMTITVDNASSNDGGIVYMKKELNKANNSIAGAKYLHMRCAAHIVNLIVTDGLKEVEISVKRVRAAVRYVKNSPARITKFKECAELEKVDTKAFLNLDVATRWNSTYFMLKAAVSYEKVFAWYSDEDPYFALHLLSDKGKDKRIGVPDDNDWENARKMADFLGHFADLTTRVSASLHVTANNFFHEIGEVNLLVKNWMDSEDVLQKAMAQRMKDKFDKYWGNWHESDPSKKGKEKENINLMIFISAALDPRLHPICHF
ncbi:hypothetical protein ACQ4PT_041401 [Festuca glaucescens]